jgi:DNA-binding transcriptional MerR regulator
MQEVFWKVGELARLSGVSVRTLHYYDEIGLLSPSRHSEAGYRLYEHSDVVRLGQISSLRSIGFSLDDVRHFLSREDSAPQQVIGLHLARLREQIALQQELCARLEAVEAALAARRTVSSEEFLQLIQGIIMTEKYFTPEQRAELEERGRTVGEVRIKEVEAEWPRLMDEVRTAMERGDDPASEPVRALARRWAALIIEFTGGNPAIHESLNTMYQQEDTVAGMDVAGMRDMFAYITEAQEAMRQQGE